MKPVLLRELLGQVLSTPILISSAILQVAESTFSRLKGMELPLPSTQHAGYGWDEAGDEHVPEGRCLLSNR